MPKWVLTSWKASIHSLSQSAPLSGEATKQRTDLTGLWCRSEACQKLRTVKAVSWKACRRTVDGPSAGLPNACHSESGIKIISDPVSSCIATFISPIVKWMLTCLNNVLAEKIKLNASEKLVCAQAAPCCSLLPGCRSAFRPCDKSQH